MREITTPSITAAQVVAVVGAIIGAAVAFGAPITQAQTDAVLQLVTIVAGVLLGADAVIRHGRSKVAAVIAAQAVAPKE